MNWLNYFCGPGPGFSSTLFWDPSLSGFTPWYSKSFSLDYEFLLAKVCVCEWKLEIAESGMNICGGLEIKVLVPLFQRKA